MENVNFSENTKVNVTFGCGRYLEELIVTVNDKEFFIDLEKQFFLDEEIAKQTIGSYFNPEYATDHYIEFECIKGYVIPCVDEYGDEFEVKIDDELFKFINANIEEKAIEIFIKDMDK